MSEDELLALILLTWQLAAAVFVLVLINLLVGLFACLLAEDIDDRRSHVRR